ncbi:hypothetical protein ACIOD2_32140 [Amycolatopsis sp. NPDC088138]|uniref:hypothetical protein n=1 Tax=Amycolatopsis sp. NPDC088138 TaxID=3363938 RepID=UPI0038100104
MDAEAPTVEFRPVSRWSRFKARMSWQRQVAGGMSGLVLLATPARVGEPVSEELQNGERVSAHRLDRMGTVVVGELMPYDDNQGERVRDDNGAVWCVVADSVRVCSGGVS